MIVNNNLKMNVYTTEWAQDFDVKNKILEQRYTAITAQEVYNIIFGDLTIERPLFLRDIKKPVIAKGYDEIVKYIEEYDTVFVYLQEFRKSYSRGHESIDIIYALVVDLDGVRSHNLHEVLELVESAPLKPNLIVSSGNGVHLYYLLEEPFPFYDFTYATAFASYSANIVLSRKGAFNLIKRIHRNVCNWYRKKDQDYKIDVLHLSQPLRMCGAKTKNPEYRTKGFKVTDHKLCMEDLAKLVDVKLVDEEIESFLKARDPQFVEEHAAYLREQEQTEENNKTDCNGNAEKARISFRNYRKNREAYLEKWKEAFRGERFSFQGASGNERKVYDAVQHQKKQRKVRENGRTSFQLFEETTKRILNGAQPGNRHHLLHILCSRGGMYKVPIEQLTEMVKEIADHFTALDPQDPISDKDIASALTAYEKCWKYSNNYVSEKFGIDLSMENKRNLKREAMRATKVDRNLNIEQIAEFVFEETPKTSLREFHRILVEHYGIRVSRSWVVGNENLKLIKSKHQVNE